MTVTESGSETAASRGWGGSGRARRQGRATRQGRGSAGSPSAMSPDQVILRQHSIPMAEGTLPTACNYVARGMGRKCGERYFQETTDKALRWVLAVRLIMR